MIRIGAFGLMLLGSAAQATEPDADALREKAMEVVDAFVESAALPVGDKDQVTVELVDLNGRPPRDAFVIVTGRKWCAAQKDLGRVLRVVLTFCACNPQRRWRMAL